MYSLSDSWNLAQLVRPEDRPGANGGAIQRQRDWELPEEQLVRLVARVCGFMRGEREHYLSLSKPLDNEQVEPMRPFFSPTLLAGVKAVQLVGRRTREHPFFQEARALGIQGLPQLSHMPSVTFEDVLVFNEKITERLLFHALVPSVQFKVLGLQRYMELYVRALLDTRWRISVPLVTHMFELESRFAADPKKSFSIEDEVRVRLSERGYELS